MVIGKGYEKKGFVSEAEARELVAKAVAKTGVKGRKVLEARGLKDRLVLARASSASPQRIEPRSAVMCEAENRLRRKRP